MKPTNPSDKMFIQARLPVLLSGLPYQCLISCPMLLFSWWYKYYPLPFQTQAVGSSPLRFLERRQNWQTFKCKFFLKHLSVVVWKSRGEGMLRAWEGKSSCSRRCSGSPGPKQWAKKRHSFFRTAANTALAGQWQIFEVMGHRVYLI